MARWVLLCVMSMVACGGKDSAKRAQQQLDALQKKKEADAKAAKEKENAGPVVPKVVELPAPYDAKVVIQPDGPCPEGTWALLPGPAPGATPEAKKSNEAARKGLADGLKASPVMIKMRVPQVSLSAFDAPKGQFVITVPATIDCVDPTTKQRVALTWGEAKAGLPPASAAKEGSESMQHVWQAPPVTFFLPMKTQAEAKAFEMGNRVGLSARVVVRLGRAEVDRKVKKVAKVQEKAHGEMLSFGGGSEDWGAGPLIRSTLVALRVATGGEKEQLFELRP
jgi:hypothetical protein